MASGNGDDQQPTKSCLACGAQLPFTLAVCPKDGTYLVGGDQESLVGTTLSERYEVMSVIGEGGMGVVYKARHLIMGRMVAIKTLHSHLVSNQKTTQRFKREATLAQELDHPNIVSVFDFGVTPKGQPYLVLSYLEGIGLDEILKRDGALSTERALRIFSQVADGLGHAHAKGIVHRDLKPSNIMLVNSAGESDLVKIVDFGIAKALPESGLDPVYLTQIGETFGSPLYMSPEQCMGSQLDARSDIYTLGCVMYESLTGRVPIRGANTVETMTKHVSQPPLPFKSVRPDIAVPAELERVVFKALRKEPEKRYQSLFELKKDLDAIGRSLTEGSPTTVVITSVEPEKKAAAAPPRALLIAAVVVATALAVVGLSAVNPEFRHAFDEGIDAIERLIKR